jgi:hypothetical protein
MKISELHEAIKGWKHAHSDLIKMRAAKAQSAHTAKLVSLKKDGTESRMHDAETTYATEAEARTRHADLVKLNPGRRIRHNLYVDGKFMEVLDGGLTEVSHKVGMAAGEALAKGGQITSAEQQKHMEKFKQLQAKAQELAARPDAQTGKYAKEFQHLDRQKTKVARSGNLNAFGEPLEEHASAGATSAGSIASLPMHQGAVIRRPNLFGYVPNPKKSSVKSGKKTSAHK